MISERTMRIAELFNSGMTQKEISAHLAMPPSTVKAAIWRLREKSIIPPRKPSESREAILKKYGFRMGSLWIAMEKQNVSTEIREWMLRRAMDEGHESLADYAVDMLVEEYFEANQ